MLLVEHLEQLYTFYGEQAGVRIARKHIGWYTKPLAGAAAFRQCMNQLETAPAQLAAVRQFFDELEYRSARLIYGEELAA
jgi:tRNA-dihydrouridine synthase B